MQDDTLSDVDLEREIERALAVDPSPELLARVRTRIATEPSRTASTAAAARRVALLASAAAVAIIVGLSARIGWHHTALPSSEAPVMSAAAPRLSSAIAGPLNALIVTSPGASRSEAPLVVRQTRSRSRNAMRWIATQAEPEVMVDRRESETVRRLIARFRDSAISRDQASPLHRADQKESVADPQLIGNIEPTPFPSIPPIDIQPLEVATHEEGARQ